MTSLLSEPIILRMLGVIRPTACWQPFPFMDHRTCEQVARDAYVDTTVCWRCGARAGIDCGHRPLARVGEAYATHTEHRSAFPPASSDGVATRSKPPVATHDSGVRA